MVGYLGKRLIESLVVLFGALVISFVVLRVVPSDPARLLLGDAATPEQLDILRRALGLDRSMPQQLAIYLGQVIAGDFGLSYRTQQPVTQLLAIYLPATIQLASVALLITVALAVPAGAIAALYKGSWLDGAVTLIALLGQSIPAFWLGIILILSISVGLGWLPTSGAGTWRHLILPATTIAAAQIALIARIMRSSMLDVLNQDYIRTARAKGLTEWQIIARHASRNALPPVVTVLGLQIGTVLGGTIVIETVFAWPGVGALLVNSIAARDFPVVQAMIVLSALVFVVINLLVDIVYMILDPRVTVE